jgi:ACR3 family arsenite efflux pump ArsB
MKAIFEFINRYLIRILICVVAAGLVTGTVFPAVGPALQTFYPVYLFIMLYPMMVGIRIGEVAGAARRIGFISVVMLFNYLLSPLAGAALARLFLASHPDFAVGMILTGVVPCAGMIVAWTGMAGGNSAMALVITILSLLAGIILIPAWMVALANSYVPVDGLGMLKTILITIVLPLILGNITRIHIVRRKGQKRFMEVKKIAPAVSALGMYSLFFTSMCAEAHTLIRHPEYLLLIAMPLVIFYSLLFCVSVLYGRVAGLSYEDMVAMTYGVGGKNMAIALALAIVYFSPLTVMIVAMKPLIQVMFMGGFNRLAPRLRGWWERSPLPAPVESHE